jgi:hypothetical protein
MHLYRTETRKLFNAGLNGNAMQYSQYVIIIIAANFIYTARSSRDEMPSVCASSTPDVGETGEGQGFAARVKFRHPLFSALKLRLRFYCGQRPSSQPESVPVTAKVALRHCKDSPPGINFAFPK